MIRVAKTAGFCFGVNRAVETARQALRKRIPHKVSLPCAVSLFIAV